VQVLLLKDKHPLLGVEHPFAAGKEFPSILPDFSLIKPDWKMLHPIFRNQVIDSKGIDW
jgi:hypothetical protein